MAPARSHSSWWPFRPTFRRRAIAQAAWPADSRHRAQCTVRSTAWASVHPASRTRCRIRPLGGGRGQEGWWHRRTSRFRFPFKGAVAREMTSFPGLPGASGKPIHGFNGWRCRRCRCSGTGAAWCRRRRPACPGKGDGLRQATHLDFLPWVGEQYRALFEQVQRSLGIGDRLRELREGLSQNAGPRRLQYAFQDDGNFGACGQVRVAADKLPVWRR